MKKQRSRHPLRRRGSAFVVVLGMLSVMILMGVAFATFIQTEQSGSTSLKNGLVARQSLNSALARVIESIDLSFGGVSNEWPICVWPQPWLSSSPHEDHDYIQSARCDGKPDARIVTKEIADLLTPSQLALARSAQVGWAPVYGSVEATRELPWDEGSLQGDGRVIGRGQYRVGGLDAEDSVVGRYAFIALETTGLLDINRTGGGTVSNSAWHGDPAGFVLPGTADRALDPDGNEIPLVLVNAARFVSARNSATANGPGFSSFSAATNKASGAFEQGLNKPKKESDPGYLPADLFANFAPSLEELAPDGKPRVRLPSAEELKNIQSGDARRLASRIYGAMSRVFAESWCDEKATSGGTPWTGGYTVFARHPAKYRLSQARLATVSLIDAMDPDGTPGAWCKTAGGTPLVSMWKAADDGGLPEADGYSFTATGANGKQATVDVPEDKLATPLSSNNEFLNYPCTESAPLVNRVWARVVPDDGGPDFAGPSAVGASSNATMTVYARLEGGAVAGFQNEVPEGDPLATKGNYTLDVEWEVMLSVPKNSVAKDDGSCGGYVLVCGEPDKEKDKKPHRDWFFDGDSMTEAMRAKDVVPLPKFSASKELSDEAGKSGQILEACVEESDAPEIKIVCRAWGWYQMDPKTHKTTRVWRDGVKRTNPPDNAIQGDPPYDKVWFYPVTQSEEDDEPDNDDADTSLFVRFKTTVKKGKDVVQQIPAPKLTEADDPNAWWIRVDPVVYHPSGSLYAGDKGQEKLWWERSFAAGWAMCLDPVFGFDTSSLYTSGENDAAGAYSTYAFPGNGKDFHGFWINDAIARTFEKFSAKDRDKQLKTAMEKLVETLDAPKAQDDWLFGSSGPADKKPHWSYVQKEWLWDAETDCAPATRWLGRAGDVATGGAALVPDNLHAWKQKGSFGGLSGASAACPHQNGGPFFVRGTTGKANENRTIAGLKSHIRNKAFDGAGELGRVRIGPYETLSLFRTYRFGTKHTDIHRVLDWFTVGKDRSPEGPTSIDTATGAVSWPTGDLFSGLHAGRANLNAPPLLRWIWNDGNPMRVERVKRNGNFFANPYPLAAAMTGANLLDEGYHGSVGEFFEIPSDLALEFSGALAEYGGVLATNRHGFWEWLPDYPVYGQTNSVTIKNPIHQRVKTRLSDVGVSELNGVNPLLQTVSEYLESELPDGVLQQLTDEDREAIVANTSEAMTVRGQTFLVILRADAYTPRYGEETAEDGEGTTLATTHALVELFRDPRFARHLDGADSGPPEDAEGHPVFFHGWYIRSMTIL